MSIGVEGQFYLRFKIGDNDDFLDRDDFFFFNVYEYAGNLLPTFEWSFRTQDESILKRLNEGNLLQAQYGRSREELRDVQLSISSLSPSKDGANFTVVTCNGYASQINYITNHNIQITGEQSGVETSIAVAQSNGFTVKGNVTKSADKQRWIQHNTSDKAFVNNCYMRSDIPNSAVSIAITADNLFVIKDLRADFERPKNNRFDWKFTKNPSIESDIVYDSDGDFESQAGFINNWIGYGREIKLIDNVTGEVSSILEQPEVVLSLANKVDKLSSVNDRYGGSRYQSESVHSNYHESYNHNLIFLANLSKIENTVSTSDKFFGIKPLDLVMYSEEGTERVEQSSDYKSGLFVASGVVRNFQADRVNTTVILNREALNEVVSEA
jgi:hypothetical protein